MARNKTDRPGRGRLFPKFKVRLLQALIVCGVAYLIVGSRTVTLRGTDFSAAETVAMRFPENWDNVPAVPRVLIAAIGKAHAAADARSAMLSPERMMPQINPLQASAQGAARRDSDLAATADLKVASADLTAARGSSAAGILLSAPAVSAGTEPARLPVKETRAAVAAVRPIVNRPGYMLNDSQIASIKARLHLTPEQERMWPTVEVALRNMTYAHAPPAHGRGSAVSDGSAIDPDSLQSLKSAAVPLILSFNTEQKNEVRGIVHVMGLDQLASQF